MDSSHLDTSEQNAALLRRVRTFSTDKDDSKWTPLSACGLLFQDIEERIEVPDGDLGIFSFGHACGRDTQSPDACVVLCYRLLNRGRIGQKVVVLDGGELWVRRGFTAVCRGTAGKNDPRRERATSQIGHLANAIVSEKATQDS